MLSLVIGLRLIAAAPLFATAGEIGFAPARRLPLVCFYLEMENCVGSLEALFLCPFSVNFARVRVRFSSRYSPRLSERERCAWVSAAEVLICFSPLRQRWQKKYRHTHARTLFLSAHGRDTEKEDLLTQRANPKSALREISLTGFFFTPALKPTAFESKRLHGSGPVWTTGASFRRMHKFTRSSSKWSRKKLAAENRGGDERQMMRNGARRPSYFSSHTYRWWCWSAKARRREAERESRVPFRSNISSEYER